MKLQLRNKPGKEKSKKPGLTKKGNFKDLTQNNERKNSSQKESAKVGEASQAKSTKIGQKKCLWFQLIDVSVGEKTEV